MTRTRLSPKRLSRALKLATLGVSLGGAALVLAPKSSYG